MKNINVKTLAKLSIVAALYVALTLALAPLSYGAIQFRVSEVLMLLVVYNPIYSIALIIGCLLSNIASSLGAIDIVVGTLATAIACVPMMKIKNLYISSIFPSIANAIIVGLELMFVFDIPLYIGGPQVFLGEFVVVTLIGIPLFKSIEKNKTLRELLEIEESNDKIFDKINYQTSFAFAFALISIIMFIYLGLSYELIDDANVAFSLNDYAKSNPLYYVLLALPFVSVVLTFFSNKLVAFISNLLVNMLSIALLIVAMTTLEGKTSFYFYSYFIVFALMITLSLTKFRSRQ